MDTWRVFGIFLLVRIISVFLVETWYVPDEYWQSLEVAHKLVYGYGYLTWEWIAGIRSYLHPLIIAAVYKVLNIVRLDSAEALILLPRILQATLSAYSDVCFWKWCGKSKWSIFSLATSWFWFYTGSRTLLNTVETCLTTIALSKFPFKKSSYGEEKPHFIWLVGLICAMRPTAAIIWLPLCIYHLQTSKMKKNVLIFVNYLTAITVTVIVSCAIDSWCHGSLILTWWEFLKVNVFSGVGEFYGSNPWHWYLSQGLPAILGVQLVPFILSSVHILRNREAYVDELALLATITFTVFVYSTLGHKEFRFLLPLLPIILHISSQYLSTWSRKANDIYVWIVAGIIITGNFIPAVYLSQYHQRGNLDVMKPLREIAAKDPVNTNLLFLMPCHSTPFYSHLHVNVTARFLTCTPNLAKVDGYVDEADHFFNSPGAWLRNNYPPQKPLPSHLIFYDVLAPYISDILSRYKPVNRIYNTKVTLDDARVGKYVTIYERVDV